MFDNVVMPTDTLGLSFGRASAMTDLDQDGRQDIVIANAGTVNKFYHQLPDATFEDGAALWGIPLVAEYEWGVLAADFDNDGDDDVYFVNGGEPPPFRLNRPYPNRMLRNDIATNGQIVDVSSALGAAGDTLDTFGAAALDFDRDGMLDIFATNKGVTCRLFRNEGGLVFSEATSAAGFTRKAEWRHAGACDYDLDGWPDAGAGCGDDRNALYRNNGDGSFTDVAVQLGCDVIADTFGMVFQDYDNDGIMDIYVALYQRVVMGPSPVFLGQANGTFVDVSPGSGMGSHTDMGHDSGDVDADGFPDIMMGTGNPSFTDFDYLYRVRPNGTGGLNITDISSVSRFSSGGQTRQHGQAMGDFDRDGDIDIYCNNGGPEDLPNTIQSNFFWRNQGNSNAWAALEVSGVYSNRTGVGLRAKATTAEGVDVYRTLQVGRGFSNTPDHALHFGIGNDTAIERIELTWPSGIVQIVDEPLMSAYTKIVETGAILRGVPAIGQSFSYDIAGAAGEVVELGFSLTSTTMALDGVNGDLGLGDPYVLLPPIPLTAAGRQTITLPIPNLISLVGLTLYSQSWIHDVIGLGTVSELSTFTIQ